MKKILIILLMVFASIFAKPNSEDINFRIGGTFALGFDSLASGSEIAFGFKMEPGLDIDIFRVGLDFELNVGWQYTKNKNTTETECYTGVIDNKSYCYTRKKLVDDEISVLISNLKLGLPIYLQSENIGLLFEPYFVVPLGIDNEIAKLDDDTFTSSAQIAFGIRGGIRFYKYHQITIGYEQASFKLYNEASNKITLAYSILWQKTETQSKTTYSSYSTSTTPISASYIIDGDTTNYTNYYSTDTTNYYGSTGRVYVRGHFRHYKSGKVSYVRPHTRSYPGTGRGRRR